MPVTQTHNYSTAVWASSSHSCDGSVVMVVKSRNAFSPIKKHCV